MKLSARDIDGFIRAPHKAGAALLYGTDAGQVRQRAAAIAESWLGNRIDDAEATLQMATRFGKLIDVWNRSHA